MEHIHLTFSYCRALFLWAMGIGFTALPGVSKQLRLFNTSFKLTL